MNKRNSDIIKAMLVNDIKAGKVDWFIPFGVYARLQHAEYYSCINTCINAGIQLPEHMQVQLEYDAWLDEPVSEEDVAAFEKAVKELLEIIAIG